MRRLCDPLWSKVTLLAVALSLVLGGCNCGKPVTSEGANGIYRLTKTTISDTCMPKACEGDAGAEAVTSTLDGSVNVPVNHCFGGKNELGTTRHLSPSEYTIYDGCGLIIGRESIAVDQVGPPLVVRVSTVLDAGECPLDGGVVSAAAWPPTGCSVEQRYTFNLIEDCQYPCVIRNVGPNFSPVCECP